MTTTYFNTSRGAAASFAPLVSSQSSSRAPIAPWIETGFVAIPIEFFHVAASQLSARAQKIYFLHCSKARTKGEGAGFSYAYRETLARQLGCSVDTVDRGNAELEKHGLIQAVGRRYPHGGAMVYRLNPPSKWTLDTGKSAASAPHFCDAEAAKVRRKTKDPRTSKTKKQQPHAREVKAIPREDVVVEVKEVEAVPAEEKAVVATLQGQGVEAQMALHWVACYGEKACLRQLERLGRQKNVRNRVGWLRCALLRGDKDEQCASPQMPSAPKPELSLKEKTLRQKCEQQQEEQNVRVAEQVLASLDPKTQAFVLRCVELEKTTLLRVIEREENYAFTVYTRRQTQ